MIMSLEFIKWVEEVLSELHFVMWDRFSIGNIVDNNDKPTGEKSLTIYGWIDRETDTYKDTVVIDFLMIAKKAYYVTTSSEKYSEKISEIMGKKEHNKCERAETYFKIPNVIKLKK